MEEEDGAGMDPAPLTDGDGGGEQHGGKRAKPRPRERGTVFTNFAMVEDMYADQFFKDLQTALVDHDCAQTSSLVSILMAALARGAKPDGKQKRRAEFRAVMLAGLEVLRHHPQSCSGDRLRKYLRTAQAYEKQPSHFAALAMELAVTVCQAGEEEQALGLMSAGSHAKLDVGTQYRVRAASGQLRYHQWLYAWLEGADHDPTTQIPDAMGYEEALWARSKRQALEYWKDAESSLRAAVGAQPAATEVVHLLLHLLLCAGRIQQAMDVVAQLRDVAVEDADAHALTILMLQSTQRTPESLERLEQAYVDLLMVDPASHQAINGFLNLCNQKSIDVSLSKQVLCICLHLDVAGDVPASSHLWLALADVLDGAASAFPVEDVQAAIPQYWTDICDVLAARRYWTALYFSDHPKSLSSGTTEEVEFVTAKAICAAFIANDSFQYSSHIAELLLKAGSSHDHDSIQQAMDFCKRLAELGAPGQINQGGLAEYGKHNVKYGTIVQMPKSWWKSFPPYRRKS